MVKDYWQHGLFPRYQTGWYGPYGARPGIERPDAEIRADIIAAMEADPWVELEALNVQVDHGVVHLSGQADSPAAKRAAEDDAWAAPGVVDVHNSLLLASDE